ncbi:hypothetical protein ACT048_24885 [Ectopseudomonas khazarica]|uniref:hypothetical protein n=1 Tax=Ectopseudomonas khazarica TaxID=2502979 RepID=UPI0040348495
MRAAVIVTAIALVLSGCAASVKKSNHGPLSLYADAKKAIIFSVQGSEWVQSNPEWLKFRAAWLTAMRSEAIGAGINYADIGKAKRLAPYPATVVAVDVSNFRYVSKDERYGLGVMIGNAWVNSQATFSDWQTGEQYAERTYDTSSSAWEGVFSAMTKEQIQAISREIVAEITTASGKQRYQQGPKEAAKQVEMSREERIRALQAEKGLPYEEYQRRYRQIMGQ